MSEALARLAGYDSPTLSNAIEAFGVRGFEVGFCGHGLKHLVSSPAPLVGRAVTATMGSREPRRDGEQRAALYEAVAAIDDPVVLVIVDEDERPGHGAFLGEVQATLFRRLGAIGIATNGAVRDLGQLRRLGFGAYGAGVAVSHAYAHLHAVNVPVVLDGMAIAPGDVLHGDEHGLLAVPSELVERLPGVADAIIAAEGEVVEWVTSSGFKTSEILERLAAVKAAADRAVRLAQ